MMIKFLLIIILHASFIKGRTQSASIISVNLKDKVAYKSIAVSNDLIKIGSISGDMIVTFPDADDYSNYSIQFNEDNDKNKITISFVCDGKNCLQVRPSDMVGNQLKLSFKENKLIAIGTRIIKEVVLTKIDSPYVKIITKEKKPDDMYAVLDAGTELQKDLAPDKNIVQKICFFSSTLVCKDCDSKEYVVENRLGTNLTLDYYHQVFTEPNTLYKSLFANKSSAKYWVINDYREGKKTIVTYLKNKGKNGIDNWIIKKGLTPIVGKQIVYTVIGPSDSSYVIDTSIVEHFIEQESQISSVISGVKTTPNTETTVDTQEKPSLPNSGVTPQDALRDNVKVLEAFRQANIFSPFSQKEKLLTLFEVQKKTGLSYGLTDDNIESIKSNKQISVVVDSIITKYASALNAIQQLQDDNKKFKNQIELLNKSVKRLSDSILILKDTLNKIQVQMGILQKRITTLEQNLAEQIAINTAYPSTKNLLENFIALERDIEKFNGQYEDISFRKEQYKEGLLCLQLKIKDILNIPVNNNSKDLAQSLINLTATIVRDKGYYKGYINLIKAIEAAYSIAVSKKITTSLFSSSKKVANVDEFEAKIKTSKSKDYFYQESFNTCWGLKIDFSTGIFLTGLTNPEFNLASHTFQYRPRTTVVGSRGQDSIVFSTGSSVMRDTTGNLIQQNQSSISYSAGFLAHIYPRTGRFVNLGLTTGVTINNNNNSPLQLMLGGSLMFNTGKSRVSIVGGIVWGQVKELSSVASPYIWDGAKNNTLYNSQYDVPSFFNGSSDIPTYDTWKHSWFFGITYNFASLNLGK